VRERVRVDLTRGRRLPAPVAPAPSATPEPGRRNPSLPESLLEVRVTAGRVDVVEFYSHGRAAGLRLALRRLGLVTRQDFESPCG